MQRSTHLEPLSHDHFEGLLVARRVRAGLARKAPPEVIAPYVAHFWKHYLSRHFEQEEALLLPLLDRIGAGALGERMVREHRSLEELVTALDEVGPERASTLGTFAATLRDHIRFEERELFPELERRAAEADLVQVGQQLDAAHVDADLDWPQVFWE